VLACAALLLPVQAAGRADRGRLFDGLVPQARGRQASQQQADGRRATASTDPAPAPDIAVPAPDDERRVTAGAAIRPEAAKTGSRVVIFVKVRVAPHHWIYALENSGSTSVPTTVTVPAGALKPAGPWRGPEPKMKDGLRTLAGDLVFQRPFLVERRETPSVLLVPIRVRYQVCNEALCWPATTITLEAALKVVRERRKGDL